MCPTDAFNIENFVPAEGLFPTAAMLRRICCERDPRTREYITNESGWVHIEALRLASISRIAKTVRRDEYDTMSTDLRNCVTFFRHIMVDINESNRCMMECLTRKVDLTNAGYTVGDFDSHCVNNDEI